jgi:hypothetical protein
MLQQQQHNPAGAAQSGGDSAELLDRLDCGVKILSGECSWCAAVAVGVGLSTKVVTCHCWSSGWVG